MIIHSPGDLAAAVNNQRKSKKMSQAQVADLVGIKQATVSAFENKPEGSKLETLFSILSAVNLEMQLVPRDSQDEDAQW